MPQVYWKHLTSGMFSFFFNAPAIAHIYTRTHFFFSLCSFFILSIPFFSRKGKVNVQEKNPRKIGCTTRECSEQNTFHLEFLTATGTIKGALLNFSITQIHQQKKSLELFILIKKEHFFFENPNIVLFYFLI